MFTYIGPSEIENCHVFLPVVDRGALKSPHVERECELADKRSTGSERDTIKIIPYRVEDCDSNKGTGYYLQPYQRIDGIPHTPESLKKLVEKVISALEAMEKTRREQEEDEKLSERLLKERRTILRRYQELQDENRRLQREGWRLQGENQALENENRVLQKQYQTLQKKCRTLQGEKLALQKENQGVQACK